MTEKYFRQKINMGSKNTELYAKSKYARDDEIMNRKKVKAKKHWGKVQNPKNSKFTTFLN
jgi:hypothetical protein